MATALQNFSGTNAIVEGTKRDGGDKEGQVR
jgi:hypothetical protein